MAGNNNIGGFMDNAKASAGKVVGATVGAVIVGAVGAGIGAVASKLFGKFIGGFMSSDDEPQNSSGNDGFESVK